MLVVLYIGESYAYDSDPPDTCLVDRLLVVIGAAVIYVCAYHIYKVVMMLWKT